MLRRLEDRVREYLSGLLDQVGARQESVGRAIGKSQTWVSQYRNGTRGNRATLDDLDALARFFNRTLGDVLVAVQKGEKPDLTPDERWLALGRALHPKDRRTWEDALQALVKARGENPRVQRGSRAGKTG
jgi:transcriptional regulator with XRE-family HTH domain